jgi:hypothetical protein
VNVIFSYFYVKIYLTVLFVIAVFGNQVFVTMRRSSRLKDAVDYTKFFPPKENRTRNRPRNRPAEGKVKIFVS